MGIWSMNAAEMILAGGPIMIPIVICSMIALGIVVAKLIYFANIQTDLHQLKRRIFDLVKANKFKEAVDVCDHDPSPVARILKAGVLHFGSSRGEIKEAMENVSVFEVAQLEKRFTALATIAHVTPLLGLLGTVTGMSGTFYTIQMQASTMNPVTPGDLAGGIWEALLTTVAGLMVAIPTYVAYNYLISRVNACILEMERAGSEFVDFLTNLNESQTVYTDTSDEVE